MQNQILVQEMIEMVSRIRANVHESDWTDRNVHRKMASNCRAH